MCVAEGSLVSSNSLFMDGPGPSNYNPTIPSTSNSGGGSGTVNATSGSSNSVQGNTIPGFLNMHDGYYNGRFSADELSHFNYKVYAQYLLDKANAVANNKTRDFYGHVSVTLGEVGIRKDTLGHHALLKVFYDSGDNSPDRRFGESLRTRDYRSHVLCNTRSAPHVTRIEAIREYGQ